MGIDGEKINNIAQREDDYSDVYIRIYAECQYYIIILSSLYNIFIQIIM